MIARRFDVPIESVPRSHSTSILTVCAVFFGLAWIAVVLRLWTRGQIVRAVGWDDGWMLISIIFFSVLCVTASTLTFIIDEKTVLTESFMTLAINLLLVGEVFYILTMMALKGALALFFLRIIVESWQRKVIYATLTVSTVFGTGYFFFAVFQCGVPHGTSLWMKKLSGECLGTSSILGLGYTFALVNALTDLVFVSLSIPMLKKVRITRREKVIVGGIFFLASVGCIASFIRLPYVKALTGTDLAFFKNLLWLVIWSTVEPGLGITAASLATLRPLLRRLESQFSSLTSQSRSGSHSNPSEASLASKPTFRARSQSQRTSRSPSRTRNKLQKPQREKMDFSLDTATSTIQSSTVDSMWKESGLHVESGDGVGMIEQQQPREQLHPIQQRNLQQRYEEEKYRLGLPEDKWFPRPIPQPGHILVSGETTTEQRIIIKNNPFRFGRRKKSKDPDDRSPAPQNLEGQREDERRVMPGERKGNIPEEGMGVIKNSPWRVARRKKGGSWLPLALFGSKTSLERVESDTDESGPDPDGPYMRGRPMRASPDAGRTL